MASKQTGGAWLFWHERPAVNSDPATRPDPEDPHRDVQPEPASRPHDAFLAGLVASLPDAIVSIDEHRRIVLFNPAAERVFGVPQAEALGRSVGMLLPMARRDAQLSAMREFMTTPGRPLVLDEPHRFEALRGNGEVFPVEATLSQTGQPGERIFTAIARDITQRLKDCDALEESRQRGAVFAANTFEGIVVSERGIVLDCNEQFARMVGRELDALIGEAIENLVIAEDRPRIAENVRLGREGLAEFTLLRTDGTRLRVEASAKVVASDCPTGRRYTAIRDITERIATEQALRDSQADLQRAQSMAQIGSWRLDIAGDELFFSDENYRIFGIAPGTRLNYARFLAQVHPDDREFVTSSWQAALMGEGYDIEHRLLVKGEVKWVRQRADIEYEGARLRGAFGTTLEITQLKQAERALIEADRRKDEFLAILAHELRNPLTPISNAAHVLKRLPLDDPKLKWAHEVIERQLTHLTRLVDELLDVSRIVRGKITLKKEHVDLALVVQQARDMARPLIDAMGHRLEVSLPRQPVYLVGDPVRLSQVILNLLDNAAKYTAAKGQIELVAEQEAAHVNIRIRDTGMGIHPDILPRIFDLFQQGDRTTEQTLGGMGVGLTLVKRLVEHHAGAINVESPGIGAGSTFTIRLPALSRLPIDVIVPQRAPVPVVAPHRILVVDDDVSVADSMCALLKLDQHDVRSEHHGEAALKTAREFQPDLVLLDLGLPGMDGYEVARRLQADSSLAGKPPCLVAVTGYDDAEARARSENAGFDRHLVKPVSLETLAALLRGLATARDRSGVDARGDPLSDVARRGHHH